VKRPFFGAGVFKLSFVKGSLIWAEGVFGANDTNTGAISLHWATGLSGTSDSSTASSPSPTGSKRTIFGLAEASVFVQNRLLTYRDDDGEEGVSERRRFFCGVSIVVFVPPQRNTIYMKLKRFPFTNSSSEVAAVRSVFYGQCGETRRHKTLNI
jgi:hypothetical protein